MVTALVTLAALIVSVRASRRVARRPEFKLLLERIDREAAKSEEAIRDVLDRSDRRFEGLQIRSDELYR